MGYSLLMTETLTEATARAARLHAEADQLDMALARVWQYAERMRIRARAGMLRAQATEAVTLAKGREQYGAAQNARARRDLAFVQLP